VIYDAYYDPAQPRVLHADDPAAHERSRARATAAFLTQNISWELHAMAGRDPARVGAGRAWIIAAQRGRREALGRARA